MYKKFIIIGAGPAGISAGYELNKADFEVKIFEKSSSVGGLAKTTKYGECLYDIGPHRFFTLNKEIENFYLEILKQDVTEVKRLTRILYNKFGPKYIFLFTTLINFEDYFHIYIK